MENTVAAKLEHYDVYKVEDILKISDMAYSGTLICKEINPNYSTGFAVKYIAKIVYPCTLMLVPYTRSTPYSLRHGAH